VSRHLLIGFFITVASFALGVIIGSYVAPNSDNWITRSRPLAEWIYFITNSLIIVVGLYGAQQIHLLKRDISTRNRRAAQESALDYCEKFAQFVMLRRQFLRECEAEALPLYTGPVKTFHIEEFTSEQIKDVERKLKLDSSVACLNILELIAQAFLSGVADERSGCKTIGRAFCAIVATHYDIVTVRGTVRGHFQNVKELYLHWAKQFSYEELKKARSDLEKRLKATEPRPIHPIGLDE
jgi:hypothetical protein